MTGAPGRRWTLLFALVVLSACASGSGLLPSSNGIRPAGIDSAGAGRPWEITPREYPSQRLYRVKYAGPEGRASFKLTLYLATDRSYRMAAADSLGRKLWSLQVEESGRAVWLDHRRKEYCETRGADRLLLVPLARLPLEALPRLLLGRMPATPAANLDRNREHLCYLDIRGQQWKGVLASGEVDWWSLEESGEAVAWWRRDEAGGILFEPRGGLELRWQQIVREGLAQPFEPLAVPDRFREGACGDRLDG